MNIGYDLLTWEGDILRLHFWAHAFEFLKKTGAVFLQTEGKLAGCWVMQIDETTGEPAARETAAEATAAAARDRTPTSRGRRRRAAGEGHRPLRRHRDLRRQGHGATSSGSSACSGRTFYYRDLRGRDPPPLWSTTSDPATAAAGASGLRAGVLGVQRHRHAAVLPAEAAEAGARGARLPGAGAPTRSTTRTRWSRSRTRPRASSATTRARTRIGRSSRSRAARASASRPTTCSIGSPTRRPRKSPSGNPELAAGRRARGSRRRSRPRPSATSW